MQCAIFLDYTYYFSDREIWEIKMSWNCKLFGRDKECLEKFGATTPWKAPTWETEKKKQITLNWLLIDVGCKDRT
jgi:hypothetical protein